MPFRTLLVHADTDRRLVDRTVLAAAIARDHGARVLVLYPLQPLLASMFYAEQVPVQAIQAHIEIERRNAAEVQAEIADRMAREGVSWEWRTVEGQIEPVLTTGGTIADLIVMGQDARDSESPAVATVALTSGRPVLCVPKTGAFASCGRRVLVAWNGKREAARAAHDALPFLQRAENVVLFAADPEAERGASANDAAAHLAAHGAKVEVRRARLGDEGAGAAILDAAARAGADLIVMGAYGHTRLREWVFGGATRTLMQAMTVPVLFSH
jgi:nucleotide-binding universal stress UspA family protein